jgi:membrane protease YdiL (CAAX protease family)
MSEENDESNSTSSWYAMPHSLAERGAAILWAVTLVGTLAIAGLVGFSLAGTFTTFHPGTAAVLLVVIPLTLYLIPQAKHDTPRFTGKMVFIVIFWFLSAGILVPFIGFDLASIYIAISFFGLGFLAPLLYLWKIQGFSFDTLGFRPDTKRNIVISIVITATYGILVFVLLGYQEWMGFLAVVDFRPGSDPIALLPIAFVFGAVFALIAAALPEELVFRSVLQSYFAERKGRIMGILVASLIFGLFHTLVNTFLYQSYYGSAVTPVVVLSALTHSFLFQATPGLVFAVAWERTRSLLLPVMLHTIHNAVELLPFYVGVMLGIFL